MLGWEPLDQEREYNQSCRPFEEAVPQLRNDFYRLSIALRLLRRLKEPERTRAAKDYAVDLDSPAVQALERLEMFRWPEDAHDSKCPVSIDVLMRLAALSSEQVALVCKSSEYNAFMTVEQLEMVVSRLQAAAC
jgi:hypothetical protein